LKSRDTLTSSRWMLTGNTSARNGWLSPNALKTFGALGFLPAKQILRARTIN
jgi:hypothetical protein